MTPLAGLPDFALPTLPAGAQATAAAVGLVGGSPAFSVKPLLDEGSAPTGKARLRFVHPSPGTPPVDVGVGSGASFTPVFANVAFPGVAPAGNGVDANGYVETTPLQALVCVDDAPAAGLLTPCSALH